MKAHLQRTLLVALFAALAGCATSPGTKVACDPPHIQMELGNTALECTPA